MKIAIERDIERDIGGDEQKISSVANAYSSIKFKYILLPVWLASYRYRDRQYQVMINAKTREVQGDAPRSFEKIAKGLLIVISIITIFLLAQLLLS